MYAHTDNSIRGHFELRMANLEEFLQADRWLFSCF